MAIGFGYQALGRGLRPQETGVPDYVGSFTKGLEAGYKPSQLSEQLLSSMLSNKVNESKARHAEEMTLADLAHTRAGTQNLNDTHGMAGLNKQLLQQKVNQGVFSQDLNNRIMQAMSGGGQNYKQDSPGNVSQIPSFNSQYEMPRPTLRDNMMDGMGDRSNRNVQSPGNPALYHIDDMIDSDPLVASTLKKNYGFEKKVTSKYDPKTGVTSVVTQYPSGKVEVKTNKPEKTGFIPLTEKTKSTQQGIIAGVDSSIPALQKLLTQDIPKQGFWNLISPENQATYESLSGSAMDSIIAGMGLPKVQSSIDLVESMVRRKPREGEDHYKSRLRDLINDLSSRKNQAIRNLDKGLNLSKNTIIEETKTINGKTYHKINGEWHE